MPDTFALCKWIYPELFIDKTMKFGDIGRKVGIAQEWLCHHGHAIKVDQEFGPATRKAVLTFQNGPIGVSSQLHASGEIDPKTFQALVSPMLRALNLIVPPPGAKLSFGDMIVAHARQHLNENPHEIGGQNAGPWVRLYNRGLEGADYPWCAGFVSFIVRQSALALGLSKPPLDYTLSCDDLAAQARRNSILIGERGLGNRAQLLPGTIFLCRRTPNDWTHTGFVVETAGDTFESIEGNTNDAGDREGYEVCKRARGYGAKDFIRLG